MDETGTPTSEPPSARTGYGSGPVKRPTPEATDFASSDVKDILTHLSHLTGKLEGVERRMRLLEIAVRETTVVQRAPDPGMAAGRTHASQPDVISDAASQVAELMRRFVEEIGGLKRDAQLAAESTLARARTDAELIKREVIRFRDDAEAEAQRIREEAEAHARELAAAEERTIREAESKADDLVQGLRTRLQSMVDDLQRIQDDLVEPISTLGGGIAKRKQDDVVVVPNLPSGLG
jgi:uncharacterized membrane protein YqiK